jgi:SAM-dependent methyltransferase
MTPIDSEVQYEALARRVYKAASRTGVPDPAKLAIHKPLLPPPDGSEDLPGAGSAALDAWLAQKVAAQNSRHLADLGCGMGSTLIVLGGLHEAHLLGITTSPFQADIASQLVRQHGLMDRTEIRLADFEEVTLPGSIDAVLAVESTGYARDLPALARRLSEQLSVGGDLFLLDDWRVNEGRPMGNDYDRFLSLWGRQQIPALEELISIFTETGFTLHERVDLTAQVPPFTLLTRLRLLFLRFTLAITQSATKRSLIAAYLGGCYLQALYKANKTAYQYLHFKKQGP